MKSTVASSILLVVISFATHLAAAEHLAATADQYDLYQVSIQATHCKLKVSVNGVLSEDLSLDATHGGAVSAPMYEQDLKPRNTITVQVDGYDAETTVSLNVVGVTQEREVIATNQPGNVASFNLDAKKIAAARGKSFSVRFKANFRKTKPKPKAVAVSEPISEEEARAYGRYFTDLLRNKNKAKLTEEMLPSALRSPAAKGLSDTEVRQRLASEMASLLEDNVFLENKGLPIEVKMQTSDRGPSYDLRAKGSQGLIRFHAKADREEKPHTLLVLIVKLEGKIQVAELGSM